MSATKCIVRISDHLLYGEPSPTASNPDSNTYMLVDSELADVSSYTTRNYRWNVKESKFYDAGLKDQAGSEPTKVVLTPFSMTDNYHYRGSGFNFSAPAGVTHTHDISVPEARAIDGSELWLGSQTYGCSVNLSVVDKDGLFAPAGTVLEQFAFDWNIHPNSANSQRPGYPAQVLAGLYIRIEFTNPSASTLAVYGNLRMHEHKEDV